MGFYDDYVSKNGSANLTRAVNVEWVLKKLDELKDSIYIPTYNAFAIYNASLAIGTRGNLTVQGGTSYAWSTNSNGAWEIVSLFEMITVSTSPILIAYHYLVKSVR
jgi:hypothetical protein